MLRFRDIGLNFWVSNLTSGIQFEQWIALCSCVSSYRSWTRVLDSWNIQSENKFMSADNINLIISGTTVTAIVRVRSVDPSATNNIFHWLIWTPLVNWYAFKISSRSSEIEQHFSSDVSWIDFLCQGHKLWLIVADRGRLNGITRTAYTMVQHFWTKCFLMTKIIPGKILGIILWKRVFVLSIFNGTAYDIFGFSTGSEIKSKFTFSGTCSFTHVKWYTVTSLIDFL